MSVFIGSLCSVVTFSLGSSSYANRVRRFRSGALLEVIYTLGDNGSEFYPVRTAAAEGIPPLRVPDVDASASRRISDVCEPAGCSVLPLDLIASPEEGVRIFANRHPVPRFVVTNSILIESDLDQAMTRLVSGEWNPRVTAQINSADILEAPLECAVPFNAAIEAGRYESTEVSIWVETSCPSVLILNDTHYPGWKAKIDGREVDMFQANLTFRGIEIPAGRNHVEFSYAPGSLKAGIATSLISLSLMTACLWWLGRRADPIGIDKREEGLPE